ncbi:TetR family transcriptional regulator [Pseudomonas sp. LPB0260]|uniref:TetR/AcrR family transcriptional regulator n=1 Tax=Pseudomonas sp. LPB0260 TaxID=2614442 RepID=UPI0015C27FB0|nr:TetR family transcriptional regulator [Pseudomonas sp. LPB0260]QLC77534.1 TetR family transcriptional regulator [Pseudomonas sp. LPB0260]QLC77664.1 TetR family transcriptional regulator [Pseudomonas sp. LPB0260]
MLTPAQENATRVATAVAESVQYQGRKASRRGSEQRRQAILDAAMRIIVREGVRAVRHRAVAAEAGVPLSATTYYFKDINDLITDTFAQFVERSAAYMAKFWSSTEGVLQELVGQLDGTREARRQLADEIARLAVEYVRYQLVNRRDHLLAEQAFQQEALLNPRLHGLVRAHAQILAQGVIQFFEVLGSQQPEQDARLLTAIILRMEYQGLLDGVEHLDNQGMLATLKRYMHLVLGL